MKTDQYAVSVSWPFFRDDYRRGRRAPALTTSVELLKAARILWDFHCVYDELEPADAIVGLGFYDLRVAERCADLYKTGLSLRIIFTGASGNWTQGLFESSEAMAFSRLAMRGGVPTDAITLEEAATNIGENLAFSSCLIPEVETVILVTKPQTQLRCKATARKQWRGVRTLTTAPRIEFEDQPIGEHGERHLFCEMVGDLERIRTYPARGFQDDVDVPDNEDSLGSVWVNREMEKALQKEERLWKERGGESLALIPLNLVGAIHKWDGHWVSEPTRRHAADFIGWEHDSCSASLKFLLRMRLSR